MTSDLLNARHLQFACLVKCVLLNSWLVVTFSHQKRGSHRARRPAVRRFAQGSHARARCYAAQALQGGRRQKAIFVQRLNILAIDSLDPDLDK